MKNLMGFALFFLLVSSSTFASTRVHPCDHCYSLSSFEVEAEQSSFQYFPHSTGLDQVYIYNLNSGVIKFFHVNRWVDSEFQPDSAGDEKARSDERGRSEPSTISAYFRADATEMPGSPADISSIGDGMEAILEFSQFVASGVNSTELPINIDSAVSLIGPEDSAAGGLRIGLQNVIADRLRDTLFQIQLSLNNLALQALNGKIGPGKLEELSNFTVVFPDGTSIEVEVTRILGSVNSSQLRFDMKVDTQTARGPGLPFVPQSAGQFNRFSFAGNGITLAELAALAHLYGIPVTRAGGSPVPSQMRCEFVGDVLVCTLSNLGY